LKLVQVLTGLIVGMLIPSNDPALFKLVMSLFKAKLFSLIQPRKTGNAGQSPFVLVFNRAGVKSSCMLRCMAQFLNVSSI
jgi:amino acid transporter